MPAIRRSDLRAFVVGMRVREVSPLIDEIARRLGDDAYLVPNGVGNIAIVTADGREPDGSLSPGGIGRWYVGYIDTPTGEIVWARDREQSPFTGDLIRVDGGTHEANRP